MINERFTDKLMKLPLPFKLVGVGSFLTMISTVLPWYRDLDTFKTGDKFIGLSGPLYLLVFLILTFAIASFAMTAYKILNKKLPKLPIAEEHFNIASGVMCLFLLIITSSIYFHPKFGVNITMKEMGFGMMMAFLGSAVTVLGGIFQTKKKVGTFEAEGKLDKLIDVDTHQRVQQEIRPISNVSHAPHVSSTHNATAEQVEIKIESNNEQNAF